jgi:nitroimidazol reductase NimA-like FMN-containing flavoprotein (pyridoxamine 5'-phosphate oxidase superfamily)
VRYEGEVIPPQRSEAPFDIDAFLALPLVARLVTTGPTVRPIWYLWEECSFWWLTGSHSRLAEIVQRDPQVSLLIDTCELESGQVRVVQARGPADVVPLDKGRAIRKLSRYLGPDEERWDPRFPNALYEDPTTRLVRMAPRRIRAWDRSFRPALLG